jgi:predicted SAM-dependent methyltransferase
MTDPIDLANLHYPRTRWRGSRAVNADLDRLLDNIRRGVKKGLHLGAGSTRLPNLINCDYYNPDADMKVDATDLSAFEDGSIDLIESHHMIEHLGFAESEKALREWYRVLRPGGLLVVTCPDITRICVRWLKYTLLYPVHPRPEKLEYILRMLVGSQEHSAYDARRMRRLLPEAGFVVEFTYARYPLRPTPSLLTIARKPS